MLRLTDILATFCFDVCIDGAIGIVLVTLRSGAILRERPRTKHNQAVALVLMQNQAIALVLL